MKEAASARRARALHAHSLLRDAIEAGRIVPLPCEVCGCNETEAHHSDYSKPLEVRWLCRPCHNRLHKSKKMRVGWQRPIPYRFPEDAREEPLGWVHRRGIGTVLKSAPVSRERVYVNPPAEPMEGNRLWYDNGAVRRAWEEFARVVLLGVSRKYIVHYSPPTDSKLNRKAVVA